MAPRRKDNAVDSPQRPQSSAEEIPATEVETATAAVVSAETEKPVPVECVLGIPVMPADTNFGGYMSRVTSVEIQFSPTEAALFRRIYAGLHERHDTFEGVGGRKSHVDTAADVIRWLLHSVGKEVQA